MDDDGEEEEEEKLKEITRRNIHKVPCLRDSIGELSEGMKGKEVKEEEEMQHK